MAADQSITSDSGIYQIRCIANDKVYVGSATNIRKRWQTHRDDLRKGAHHSARLQRAWRKYGAESFVLDVLEIVSAKDDLVAIEQGYLDRLRTFDREIGYNVCPTAGSCLGRLASAETRAKLSASHRGYTHSIEAKAKVAASSKGRKHAPETLAKMSASQKGRTFTSEHRAKLSAAHMGKTISAEHRASLSAARIGHETTNETCAKIGAANKGKVRTAETLTKLSESHKGKKWSAKRRAAQKGRPNTHQATFSFLED